MEGESEIEIRPVFEADDFGAELTPELREQEEGRSVGMVVEPSEMGGRPRRCLAARLTLPSRGPRLGRRKPGIPATSIASSQSPRYWSDPKTNVVTLSPGVVKKAMAAGRSSTTTLTWCMLLIVMSLT